GKVNVPLAGSIVVVKAVRPLASSAWTQKVTWSPVGLSAGFVTETCVTGVLLIVVAMRTAAETRSSHDIDALVPSVAASHATLTFLGSNDAVGRRLMLVTSMFVGPSVPAATSDAGGV